MDDKDIQIQTEHIFDWMSTSLDQPKWENINWT